MNKQLLLTVFLVFAVIFSVSAISASEVNVTDSYTTSLVDDTSDVSVPLEQTADSSESSVYSYSSVDNDSSKVSLSSEEVLGSENSNTLSTNTMSNSLGDSTIGVTRLAVSSSGNEVYGAASNVSTVQLSDTIKASDITKYYKGSTKYTATFTDMYGKVLANKNVKITVNGVSYTKKTNSNGVASVDVNLKPGTYKIVAVNPVTNYKLNTTFKILSTIKANDVTKVYTDGRAFTATFLNSNGKPLANKNVKFKINGKTYTKKTNSNGVATLTMYNLNVGTYKMISYNTDGLSLTNTVKVVRSTTSSLTTSNYTFLKSDSKTIKATLLNGLGYAPGSGKVIKFTINGKTYTAKTNSNGVASRSLPSSLGVGVYTVKCSFDGNSFYKASSASGSVCIISSKNTKFTVKSTTDFINGDNAPFKVALAADTVPLENKEVIFTVNGKTYTKTTDSNGIASLPITLASGKYTISYKFNGDSKFNAASGSSQITVKDRVATSLTWKSGTSFTSGSQTFKVLLLDSNKKALVGKTVNLFINSKKYSVNTDSSGYASFKVYVGAGNYDISYKFEASSDSGYISSSGSTKVTVTKSKSLNGNGYWVFGSDMKSVSLSTLASKGITDLFLNYYAINTYGQSAVESWIASANSYGIRVHIWMQAFYSNNTWVNPIKDGSIYTSYFNQKVAEAKKYASIKGISGVHLDYLRYPGTAYKTTGGTDAITQFTKLVSDAVHSVNPSLIVSCAVMPETTSNIKSYGQNITALSACTDVIIPMVYKGNYGKTASWISTTTKWFVDNSKGAEIWVGLQGYVSDSNVTKLSLTDITNDAQNAVAAKADGVVIFRWGLTNFVDFKSLDGKTTDPTDTKTATLANILTAAVNLKNTISSTGAVPSSVSVGGVTYSTSQFLYMMAKAVENINSGKTSAVSVLSAASPLKSAGDSEGKLNKTAYLDLATRLSNYISANKQAPNYATSALGNIKYENLVDAFSRILAYYKTNSQLPNYVTISQISKSNSSTPDPTPTPTPTPTPVSKTVSIKDILTGATNLKTFYTNNGRLPNTVTIAGITFSTSEFLYLMSQAIYQIGNSNNSNIAYITGVSDPLSPSGDNVSSKQLTKGNYTDVAKNVADFIKTNNAAPNYASSSVGKIIYYELVDAFSRVLAYYNTNGALPNYVVINYVQHNGGGSSSDSGSGLNEKNTVTDLSAYLKASTNCQVNSDQFKSLVSSLTSGLTTDLAKAQAIYNYVRDTTSYSFYYNTRYGALGTLTSKTGNCVDHSHLLVAMFRTAGLAARYVHGTCKFTSGSTYGHVWTQVLINGQWYVADATSSRNSLGNVANWNTNSFTLNGIYASLSF